VPSDEFESTTENELLRDEIRARIEREGRITFRDFMALALYHPQHGYYNSPRDKLGRSGDYLTSPEVHPLFGAMIARQLAEMWTLMGRPPRFQALEIGAGSGVLCRDILIAASRQSPEFVDALDYRLSDISSDLAARQKRALAELGDLANKVAWNEPDDLTADSIEGCILSNELVDSFPVHRVVVQDGRLREIYVVWRDGGFAEEVDEPSTPELIDYFDALGVHPGEGCRAEVNLEAPRWLRRVARALRKGFVLTFDYGYQASDLYASWRRDGTLLCFYRHAAGDDPYRRLGRQDMTAHVDFTTLMRVGSTEGLNILGLTTQERFLAALGIGEALVGSASRGGVDLEEHYARRRAVSELMDPAGLGRVKVLIHAKGVEPCALTGLSDAPPFNA